MSTSTTNLPLLNWSSQLSAAPSSDGTRRASSLPIRTALPWTCFWMFSGVNCSSSAARASVTAASPRSMSKDRARARLLRLDDRLHRQGQLAVEAEAVVEDRAEKRAQSVAERRRLAVDQVLPGQPVDVARGTPPRRTTRVGLPSAMQAVADALDVDLLDRIDEPEEVDSLLRVELPDEAEVEEDDLLGRRVGQDVARVRVAVEEAVDQHLLDDRADEHRAERRGVEAGFAQLIRLRDLDPVDEFHGDDPLAGQLVVDGRDVDLGEALSCRPPAGGRGTPRCGSRAP